MAELSKTFNFAEAEGRLYTEWEKRKYFKPEVAPPDAEPFVIAIPPPNVTGQLHVGHALFVSLQDMMIRHARMNGKAALWIPGADHAGIATQMLVERMLRDEGTSRQAIGREEFIHRTWEWKEKYGSAIDNQFRRLGASVDWDRKRFTLDNSLSQAVREAFITLYEQGLIYRGPRLINWSPGLQTAVSDLEVEREAEKATLYTFRYPIEGGEFLPVATTRPETIMGDTAVAVHPEDDRYKHLIGQMAIVPIINRRIPVIGDEMVDRAFGTGALKITPAHDFNDYDVAQRHNLPMISIMNKDASLNENGGPYVGMDRYAAREKLWADLSALGLTIKTETFTHVVPRSQRGGEIVEPLLSEQWFVKMEPLAAKALAAVRDGRIKIVPERFEKVYYNWLENIRDWCISRQLWWGHQIPAFYCENGHITVDRQGPVKCATCGSRQLTQDPDVLDTWFSSGLWPFSTLGWPQITADYQRFYPTDMMETGHDILFFWVARMIMMGLWFTDQIPFHTVYLHGLVLDGKGDKMSKTKGNVIDPLTIIDQYGADTLRLTLITNGTPGNDQSLSDERIEYSRNFGNKLWQIARFVLSNLGDQLVEPIAAAGDSSLTIADRWILSRLNTVIGEVDRLFASYLYGEAGRQIQDFVWTEFADWYVEISKNALYGTDELRKTGTRAVLLHVLDACLRLLHPFMPYETEELWQALPMIGGANGNRERKWLIVSEWPTADDSRRNSAAETQLDTIRDLIVKVRNVRAEYAVEPGKKLRAVAVGGAAAAIVAQAEIFSRLCNVSNVTHGDSAPANATAIISGDVTLYLPIAEMVDVATERERLSRELDNVNTQITRVQGQLTNEGFVSRAKPEVVAQTRTKLADLTYSRESLEERLRALVN